jgi:glycosyltransferase involved in cell wall biosynthesis
MGELRQLRIVLDGKFFWHEGRAYSGHMHYELFAKRYLEAGVHEIVVCGRAYNTKILPEGAMPLDGPGVRFERMAEYKGALQFIRAIPGIVTRCWQIARSRELVMLYVPGTLPFLTMAFLLVSGRPYGCLVVADPADQMGGAALRHPLQPYARRLYMWLLGRACKGATAVLYVTQKYLQRSYPGARPLLEFGASDVNISREFIVTRKSFSARREGRSLRFVYVAAMIQAYKGHDVLIEAARILSRRTTDFEICLVGGGPLLAKYQEQVKSLGLGNNFVFLGQVNSRSILQEHLDSCDIFVIPSRAEGLPRAVVEAMARGLPVIGTNVGGMFELVPDDRLVPSERPEALANLMWEACQGKFGDVLEDMSAQSLSVAQRYLPEYTAAVRKSFVSCLFSNMR